MRRRRPQVLGEETRIGARNLPIDRWMLERLHGSTHGRRRSALPPVAWHGKFTTSPLAEPDFSATPSPVATPLAPPTIAAHAPTIEPVEPDIDIQTPATVGALALDMYTRPLAPSEEDDAPVITSVPALADTAVVEHAPVVDDDTPQIAVYEPRVVEEPPRPVAVPHEELDPDVRALVDELYQQARAELSGNDVSLFAPLESAIDDSAMYFQPDADLDIDVAPRPFDHAPSPEPPAPPVATPTRPDPPAPSAPTSPTSSVIPPRDSTRATPRGGWVAAFTPNERRRRHTTD